MSSQIKMGNVDVSQRFLRELRGFIRLWEPSTHKSLSGSVKADRKNGYVLQCTEQEIHIVDSKVFLDALKKTETQMRVNWFGN